MNDTGRADVLELAREALAIHDLQELTRRALTRIRDSAHAVAGALVRTEGDLALVTDAIDLDALGATTSLQSEALHAAALRRGEEVVGELRRDDFGALPALAAVNARYGVVVPIVPDGHRRVVAAWLRDAPTESEVLTVRGIAVILASAVDRFAAEAQLREQEAKFRRIVEQLPALLWTTDEQLVLTTLAGGGRLPKPPGAYVGMPLADVLGPEGRWAVELVKKVLGGEAVTYTFDYFGVVFDVSVEPLRDEGGAIRGVIALAVDVSTRHAAEESLRRLTARMHTIEENERRRIAHEIHDEMGQRITALRLELGLLRQEVRGTAAGERIAAIDEIVAGAGDAVRRITSDLRPALLDDFGFVAAVEHELEQFERRTGIAYELTAPAEILPVSADAATALYRIVQEALTNVARHSGARRVTVRLTVTATEIVLVVADDGRGIAPDAMQGGLGMLGLRERAFSLGGEVSVETAPGRGTAISVRLPRTT